MNLLDKILLKPKMLSQITEFKGPIVHRYRICETGMPDKLKLYPFSPKKLVPVTDEIKKQLLKEAKINLGIGSTTSSQNSKVI